MIPALQLLVGALALCLLMLLCWRSAVRRNNAALVDVVWTAGLGLLPLFYALSAVETPAWRRALIAALSLLWAGRLARHLWHRFRSEREDGRYAHLKSEWGEARDARLLRLFQMQALAALLLSIAPLLALSNTSPTLLITDIAALALALLSIAGEGLADRQLAGFRTNPTNRGKTCRTGLWAYSRHPNYFFEWLYWLSYPLLAGISLEAGLALLCGPLLMLFFLLKVSGIPPTEAQALRSRGEDYRRYQREVSAFFPWPPRKPSHHPAHQPQNGTSS